MVRGLNLLIMLGAQLLVYFFLIAPLAGANFEFLSLTVDKHILAVQCLLLVAAGGYIINDYFDVKTDQINRPEKQIIGQKISGSEAMIGYGFANVTAIVSGLMLNQNFALWLLACMLGLYAYARYLKKIPLLGNLLIAALTVAQFWQVVVLEPNLFFGKLSPTHYPDYYLRFLYEFSPFVFVVSLIRELIKTAEDIKGDQETGLNTAAVAWGTVAVKNISAVLGLLSALALGGISWLYWVKANHWGAVYLGWALCFPLLFLGWKMYKSNSQADFHRLSLWLKIYFLLGLGWLFFV